MVFSLICYIKSEYSLENNELNQINKGVGMIMQFIIN